MKALITGITGFVGQYLADHLLAKGVEVIGTTRQKNAYLELNNDYKIKLYSLNWSSTEDIFKLLDDIKPDVIFHLAGQSNVKKSWEDKQGTFYANVNQTIFLLDACVEYQNQCPNFRLLTVGSAEEYGKVEPEELPISEETPLRPLSPYGASKAAVSMLIKQYYKAYGLHVIHVRPFNHIGPKQSLGFVVPDFVSQIVEIEKGLREPIIRVGNLESIRDFTNVCDIVSAYYMLSQNGRIGEIYNVCSEKGRTVQSILDQLAKLSKIKIKIVIDVNKIRRSDVPEFVGSNRKIWNHIKWKPTASIDKTLEDILHSIRKDYHQ